MGKVKERESKRLTGRSSVATSQLVKKPAIELAKNHARLGPADNIGRYEASHQPAAIYTYQLKLDDLVAGWDQSFCTPSVLSRATYKLRRDRG